ncbi:MAG: NADH-quinone oxidoreductase subunit C [bacterium]
MTRNEILEKLRDAFPGKPLEADPDNSDGIRIPSPELPEVAAFLKTEPSLDFNYLFFISAIDRLEFLETSVRPELRACRAVEGQDVDRLKALEVLYHLYSMGKGHHIIIKTRLDRKNPVLDSVTALWPAANWHEREVYDLFGVRFDGHPDLRRILLPEDWEGHPMLRDFIHPNLIRRPDSPAEVSSEDAPKESGRRVPAP